MQNLLENLEDCEDFRLFPGPLESKSTHKKDVLQFANRKSAASLESFDLVDRESTSLLWNFLSLMVRQNGVSFKSSSCDLIYNLHYLIFSSLSSDL